MSLVISFSNWVVSEELLVNLEEEEISSKVSLALGFHQYLLPLILFLLHLDKNC